MRAKSIPSSSQDIPAAVDVVIIGGGIVGCSVAWHLAQAGVTDVVLLERKQLTCGTTWHAAGLVAQLRGTRRLTQLALYGIDLYAELEAETGQATGFRRNGSITVAASGERLTELRRAASMARSLGIEAEELVPSEIAERWPLIERADLAGGVWYPGDGQVNPVDVTMALARGARRRGVRILENTPVSSVDTRDGQVTGVTTDEGPIRADVVVNCAGMWAREIGSRCGVSIPLHACEHFYILTEAIDDLPGDLPVLRDPDGCAYYKEDAGKLLVGAFEPVAKPWGMDGIPEDFCFSELPEDLEHFMPVLEGAIRRVPVLGSTGIRTFFNGPESFTPDDSYLLGESPELKNFFVAAGFNSVGIQSAAGAGRLLAEWIAEGRPPVDIWEVDIRRTFSFQSGQSYLEQRVSETLGLLYAMHWPYRQFETARGVLRSPLHEALAAKGACFGEVAGWERANWFAVGGLRSEYEYTYGRQNWFECSAAEHRAVRETVGLFDQTSFAKFDVEGGDAEAALQRICANDVAVAVGRIVYTQWLNERGGIEADVTVTRLAEHRYRIITSPATARRDLHWLRSHLTEQSACKVHDVTAEYSVLGVMGPASRSLLRSISDDDWSDEAFPFGTARSVPVGAYDVLAQRISYVGELGWELYIPVARARGLFEEIIAHGGEYGLRLCGYHALDSCRLEKGYRSWGHDINDADTPAEAGLAFACAPDKPIPFIGRDAFLRQRETGVSRRLLQFRLRDPEPLLYHDEPVYRGGELAGYVTSAAYGHTLGAAVALAVVSVEPGMAIAELSAADYRIEIAGERYPAEASLRPMYDARGERLRA